MPSSPPAPLIAIACGGTGGHLYPGLAVGELLLDQGCDVALLVSPKEVDQQAVRSVRDMEIVTLPAVGLGRRQVLSFVRGFRASWLQARAHFRRRCPKVVLAMGGFTSAPPVLAGLRLGAKAVLHEANCIPGRANRWLAPWVHEALVYFPPAVPRLANRRVSVVGMPVRPQFVPQDAAACRLSLGLHPERPVLLVMGGSQGAGGINELVLQALPRVLAAVPDLQLLHLTGTRDVDQVKAKVAGLPIRAMVRPFLTEMELALGAATVAISRAGASSIAELAAIRVPCILIPFPAAADNHQFHNASSLVRTGAAVLLEQRVTTSEVLAGEMADLLRNADRREALSFAIGAWHRPDAAAAVADRVLAHLGRAEGVRQPSSMQTNRLQTALP